MKKVNCKGTKVRHLEVGSQNFSSNQGMLIIRTDLIPLLLLIVSKTSFILEASLYSGGSIRLMSWYRCVNDISDMCFETSHKGSKTLDRVI